MARIALGEEVDFHFVAAVMKEMISQWNHAVESLRAKLQDHTEMMRLVGSSIVAADMGEADVETAVSQVRSRQEVLKTICLKETEEGFLRLAGKHSMFYFPMEMVVTCYK